MEKIFLFISLAVFFILGLMCLFYPQKAFQYNKNFYSRILPDGKFKSWVMDFWFGDAQMPVYKAVMRIVGASFLAVSFFILLKGSVFYG